MSAVGVPVARMWTHGGNLILAVGETEIELTPEHAAMFAEQILRRIATLGAWKRAAVGEDAYCDLLDTIDPGDDEQ